MKKRGASERGSSRSSKKGSKGKSRKSDKGGKSHKSGRSRKSSKGSSSRSRSKKRGGPHKRSEDSGSRMSRAIVKDELAELRTSDEVLRKEEKAIEKEVRFIFSPEEFHVVTFVASLIILAFLLNSKSLVFYSVLTVAALAFAHFLKQHHRPHDVLSIMGLFFLPLAVTLIAFRDLLVWLLLAVYAVSVVSTVIIYYYHKKAHRPLKIMWQVTYSRIIAVTLAAILACVLPYLVLTDAFFSVFEMIFVFVLPLAFVFFFASKFFYIYFFDRKHIRLDLWRSFKHTVIYTLVFIVILMCLYAIFAAGFYGSRSAVYSDNLDLAVLGISKLDEGLADIPGELGELIVTQDLLTYASGLRDDISAEAELASHRTISLGDIVDDSYFTLLADNGFRSVRYSVLMMHLADARESLVDNYEELGGDGLDASGLRGGGLAYMEGYVEDNFRPYSQDPAVAELIASLGEPSVKFSDFEDTGLFFWFADEAGLDFVYHSESVLGRQASFVLRHMTPFRDLARMALRMRVFIEKEAASAEVIEHLYFNRDKDLVPLGSAVRHGIIMDYIEGLDDRAPRVLNVDFKVE